MLSHRYVFVGGLHRSGTSLVARLVGAHPRVAAIEGAPVPENEGVYLQGAIPHTALHGRPMHFATDPAQHHVEGGIHDRLDVRLRMEADWAPWFAAAPWRVEKSPVNLTRSRLYQQLFPLSQFVFVLRHPEIVAAAVGKWVPDPPADLIDHWLGAHDRLAEDRRHLHASLVLRYEDLVAMPGPAGAALHGFLGLPSVPTGPGIRDGNLDYPDAPRMTPAQATRAAQWGYGPGGMVLPRATDVTHPLRVVAEAVSAAFDTRSRSASGVS